MIATVISGFNRSLSNFLNSQVIHPKIAATAALALLVLVGVRYFCRQADKKGYWDESIQKKYAQDAISNVVKNLDIEAAKLSSSSSSSSSSPPS